jgi:hypothetical protein
MAGSEHFMFAKETTFGTWTTPNKALPVRTVALTGGQPLMIPDETGGGRGQRPGSPGEISATGDVTTLLHPTVLPFLLRSVFATRATSAAGTGFRNKLLIDDDISFDTFSVQKRYRADLAESLRGVKMTGFTIGARAREFATCTLNFAGKDSTITPGGTWSDGTSAPVVVDPVPYEATYVEPFKFYQGVIRLGGSVTLTAGELVVTGGTPRNDLDNVEIAFNFHGAEFYNAWKNGARAIVELFFQGPIYNASSRYELKLTLPWVVYSNGAVPELNAAYGLKRHTVEGSAFVDPTTDVDVGLVIQSPEDLSA